MAIPAAMSMISTPKTSTPVGTTQINTVWIVDDDAEFCKLLTEIFATTDEYQVIGTSGNLFQAYRDLHQHTPNVVITDFKLPDGVGLDLLKWLELNMPDTQKMVFSFWEQTELIYKAFLVGLDAYIHKDKLMFLNHEQAIELINMHGYIHPKLAKIIFNFFQTVQLESVEIESTDIRLSLTEREILQLLFRGLSYSEVSVQLGLTKKADLVDHIQSIYKKMRSTARHLSYMPKYEE